jgi:hypothetical protein
MAFSDRLLEQLCGAEAYFSDAADFNDPLDCRPVVAADVPNDELERLLAMLVRNRSMKEIDAAFKRLRLKGETSTARRKTLSDAEARELIGEINYHATNPDVDDKDAHIRWALSRAIEEELRKTHQTGVLCLSAKFDSLLMWSHYADQHRGVCVEYDVSGVAKALRKVSYGESRRVSAKDIRDWLVGDDKLARSSIDRACLLTKSKEWAYEQEWRLLGPVGLRDCGLKLKSVTFGMRCTLIRQYTIVKALDNGRQNIDYFEMTQQDDRFQLDRSPVDPAELLVALPRASILDEFKDLEGEL